MPKGKSICPVCKGSGKVTEDAKIYDFITRDPITSRCLVCSGTGYIHPLAKLPNGDRASTILGRRLNVSKKAINPRGLDLGLPELGDSGESRLKPAERPAKASGTKAEASGTVSPRLEKVMASGKEFLIVTETEPYYLDVYRMVRGQEKRQGSWTAEDEERYVAALEAEIDKMHNIIKEAMNG